MRNQLTALLLLLCISSSAQTIFTYGNKQVNKAEFWRAFTKNNTGASTEKAIRDYLDLYIRFKLKVQAAKDAKLDTLPNITSDVAGFRAQLIEQYMRNQNSSKDLIAEAAERNKQELEIAHVFVAFNNDSAAAKSQIEKAYRELQGGADFNKTSATYSNNDFVKNSRGYIGFISVFSLPYDLENTVYALTPGAFSKPVMGAKGRHIFKLISKRTNPGLMKAAQILIAVPQDATPQEKAAAKSLIDSLYKILEAGSRFEEVARTYSMDKLTYSMGGLMQEFTYTKYDPSFSNPVFALKKDMDITKPFLTSAGWHIVQRLGLTPVKSDLNDPMVYEEWNNRVSSDPRIAVAMQRMKDEMKKAGGYKAAAYNEKELRTLTDTMLKAKDYVSFFKTNKQKPLFFLTGKTVSIADWLQYAKSQRSFPKFGDRNDYKNVMTQFVNETVEQYYKDRLENTNEDFRYQLKEFTEGSLLFEVMERTIWSKAPADSAGLAKYYAANKTKYKWQPSVNAIVYNCSDTATANEVMRQMKQNPKRWKDIMDNMGGKALADSGRFEYNQLPVQQGSVLTPGLFTQEVNVNDGSASFCYIIKTYAGSEQRSFDEAKGLVINDYQQLLEEQWINQLKKKYPVKVNEGVVKGLK
ncbi:MAG: peptidyl-prolyl cis-trans isomerase [Chitinophagaceae bacterium]|nr:peptidyl-prolyl cis-trans isomerase [Chitinophagaceae bacterium]